MLTLANKLTQSFNLMRNDSEVDFRGNMTLMYQSKLALWTRSQTFRDVTVGSVFVHDCVSLSVRLTQDKTLWPCWWRGWRAWGVFLSSGSVRCSHRAPQPWGHPSWRPVLPCSGPSRYCKPLLSHFTGKTIITSIRYKLYHKCGDL